MYSNWLMHYTGIGTSGIIHPPVHSTGGIELPAIIIWNPYVTCPNFTPVKCEQCGNFMHESDWNDGSSAKKLPRTIHGINDIILLVSAVYSCEKGHKILAHDKSILEKIPNSLIPFCLLHKTGFTKDLIDICTGFCRQGINFYSMETLILEKRWEAFSRKQQLQPVDDESVKIDFWRSPMSNSPSNDVLAKCFLTGFLQHEHMYLHEMACITVDDTISFDHTFKVAANIGYLREDKKWINEYNSILLVLNKHGKVITWQLTKGTSITQSDCLFEDVAERAKGTLKTIYVDDCCKMRHKLKEIFGKDIVVKLDLFHAVQRITKTLPKKHKYFSQCVQDLRLVFRTKGDCEEKRISNTPSPTVIHQNLIAFVKKWKDATREGVKIFKPETIKATENLKRHILAGCLSNIPPGGGTNKNERLHEHIKSYFNRSRIGILLAYAILHMIFHAHNSSVTIKGKKVIRPIEASPTWLEADKSKCKAIGIMPKLRDENYQQDSWEMDLTENFSDCEAIVSILEKAIKRFQVMQVLLKEKLERMSYAVNSFEEYQPSYNSTLNDESTTDQTSMNKDFCDYGLTIVSTKSDGNCFFQGVAMNIQANKNLVLGKLKELWQDNLTVENLSTILRQIFVEEILGNKKDIYTSFISYDPDLDFTTEAKKFLLNGHFSSALGDLMPLVIATALQVTILIFSKSLPIFVNPVHGQSVGIIF